MASFEKRNLADGTTRWRYKVLVGVDREGRRRFRTGTCGTKKEAEAAARELEVRKDHAALSMPSQETVATYLRSWLDDVKKGSVRDRTWHGYSRTVRRYIEDPPKGAPDIGRIRLDRLRTESIQRLYSWLHRDGGLSPTTVRSVHAVIRQGLAHATRTGAIMRNLTDRDLVVLPRMERRDPKAMTPAEAGRFLEAAGKDRYHALWTVLLMGGLRPGEALGLLWEDVDFEGERIRIQRSLTRQGVEKWKLERPKTPRARRTVVLPETAMRALREWRTKQITERLKAGPDYEDHGFVFTTSSGKPLDQTNLNVQFKRVMRRAGLGELGPEPRKPRSGPTPLRTFTPKYRMYDLRHSCATLLLRAGENPKVVSERLGHTSVAFTMDVYTASLPDMQEGAAKRLEEILGGAPC